MNFSGRARRKEYWFFALFSLIFLMVAMMLDWVLFGAPVGILYGLFALFMVLPSLAVWVRRLHDTGRSGKIILWYYLTLFVWIIALIATGFSFIMSIAEPLAAGAFMGTPPVAFIVTYAVGAIGFLIWAIFFLVWVCTPGTQGDNKYGPDPKAVEE